MSYTYECRKCGIEIEPDVTNPYDLCDECIKNMEEQNEKI